MHENSPHRWFAGTLSWFLNRLYHSWAFLYDLIAAIVSNGRWKQWVYCVVPLLQGEKILEIGMGPGHLALLLLQKGYALTALDESREMCQITARRLSRAHLFHPGMILCADARCIPLASSHFETVAATFPAPYIFEPQVLEEIHRVLIPAGRLIVSLAARPQKQPLLMKTLHRLNLLPPMEEEEERFRRLAKVFSSAGFASEFRWVSDQNSQIFFIISTRT